ncbi:MAG: protein kinase [Acidobacteria bacterium]|nr:protein kinase [Acidobacteriota bacterium]MCA1637127.1 protein kinase [Acidobacteriota bacterium]
MPNDETKTLKAYSLLGHYRIVKKLGAGGMGEVYLAEDTKLDRRAVLKILPEDLANDAERMRRFVQEAKSASALNHPNIITIYEIGETDDTHFIATEYIEGETLHSRLKSEPMNLKSVLDTAIQIASALQAAHSAGIVHRDIKPENVMIRPDGLVKVLDFGIAKLTEKKPEAIDAEAATAIKAGTSPGMIIGTASYMSPEQARGKEVDARSDIFSFGVVLYEMITGKRAFDGETAMDVIGAILHKEPSPLSETEIPKELRRIVEKSLRKDREERYQTTKDLRIDLKDIRQELEFQNKLERTAAPNREEAKTQILEIPTTADVTASESGTMHATSSAEYVVGEIKNHKLGFAVGVVVLLATLGFGYWFFTKQRDNSLAALNVPRAVDAPKPASKLYWQMTEAERVVFIRERARHIQTLIGDEPTEFDDEELRAIKVEIDRYVEKKDSLSQKPFEEGLRVIYGRASQYAPLVIRAYEARQVPSALGLYQAMIESEYNDCPTHPHPTGPVGLFRFSRKMAVIYGLTPKDYCSVEKQSNAAAHHMSDLISDFGEEKSSWTLALFSFDQGGDKVREYLRQLRGRGVAERSFWAIFRHGQNLQPPLLPDGKQYVPRFFAAAIIGETPEVFELSTLPLSTLSGKGK